MALRPLSDQVSRLLGGFNARTESQDTSDWKINDTTRFHELSNDFDRYQANDWVVTVVGTGTAAMVAGDGGRLALTTSGASGDNVCLQWAGGSGGVMPGFVFDSTKDLVIKAQFQVDDATLANWTFGLYIADTTPIASLPTEGFYMSKPAASTTISGNMIIGGTATQIAGGTMVAAAMQQLTMVYIASVGTWATFQNDVLIARSTVLTNKPTAALAPGIAVQAGSAVIRTMTLDYLLVAKER